jgi:hypothetical protein
MTNHPDRGRRGRLLALLTAAIATGLLLAARVPLVQPSSAATAGAGASAYDTRLHEGDCELLGRDFVDHRGCSRTRCEAGAVPWRTTYGAEACTLRGAQKGYGFAATVEARLCQALHRRWIAEVNYCASEPDRTTGSLFNAPQCAPPATVYVTLQETEGYDDECITIDRAKELVQRSVVDGSSLEDEVAMRSSVQCPYRPGHVYVDGACVVDPGFQPTGGGVLMIGDSLTWRGSDELGRLRPTFTLDGEPARPPTELAARLAHYRSGHGDPGGLIIELGTVPAKGFTRQDLVEVVRSLPRATRVMFVLPYYEIGTDPVVVTPQSRRVGGWMRDLAGSRDHSCAADWPAYVRAHPGTLQDGVHAKHPAEGRWAHWISQEWAGC